MKHWGCTGLRFIPIPLRVSPPGEGGARGVSLEDLRAVRHFTVRRPRTPPAPPSQGGDISYSPFRKGGEAVRLLSKFAPSRSR